MRTSKTGKGGKKPKSVYLEISFWRAASGSGIFVTTNDRTAPHKFNVLVRSDGSKQSGHPALWKQLDRYLRANEA